MGAREEETGNVVKAPAIVGEPWWLISKNGIEFCCHLAESWFGAREIGRTLTGENVSAKLVEKKVKERQMGYACKILADSISPANHRITSWEVTFPRIVLAELNTHCMLSRNSASSRAIPVAKRIAAVLEDTFVPEVFGSNQKRMQPSEALNGDHDLATRTHWLRVRDVAVEEARNLESINVHKQYANRLLEPFSWHTAVVTATDLDNFFHLRVNPLAQGELRKAAEMMLDCSNKAPRALNYGEWHLPYVAHYEAIELSKDGIDPMAVSVARCARVSYLTQNGERAPLEDVALYGRLIDSAHMSPLEHVARPMTKHELVLFERPRYRWIRGEWHVDTGTHHCGKLNGWVSCRAMVPGEEDILGYRKANP